MRYDTHTHTRARARARVCVCVVRQLRDNKSQAPGRTVGPNYCGSSQKNLALHHLSGAYNVEVAHTFLGNLWTPDRITSLAAATSPSNRTLPLTRLLSVERPRQPEAAT